VTITTLAVVGYLLLSRERAEALWMVVAVFGGMAVNDALKLAFSRPRPDSVLHAARIFSASFPSGHASLSAIAYLTIGAFLARSQPSVKINVYRHGACGDSDRVDRDEPRLSRGFTTPPTFSEAGASARPGPSRGGRPQCGFRRVLEAQFGLVAANE
jgi:hypothetical protein